MAEMWTHHGPFLCIFVTWVSRLKWFLQSVLRRLGLRGGCWGIRRCAWFRRSVVWPIIFDKHPYFAMFKRETNMLISWLIFGLFCSLGFWDNQWIKWLLISEEIGPPWIGLLSPGITNGDYGRGLRTGITNGDYMRGLRAGTTGGDHLGSDLRLP